MRNHRLASLLKWVPRISTENQLKPCKTLVSGARFYCIGPNPRFFATRRASESGKIENLIRIHPSVRKIAEAAMLDYFYCTRGLEFMVAESMSKNAPVFLANLLKKIDGETDSAHIEQSISRYLWFHPLNEFEPFLESLGLKRSQYRDLLPGDKLFLGEDSCLLDNHRVLYNYGIPHEKMGKIYREAIEVFGYETGVLASKIRACEDLGLRKTCLCKLMICSPSILIGDRNSELVKVLEMLKSFGMGDNWLEESLSEEESYDWRAVLRVLNLLRDIGFHEDELSRLIRKHLGLIFESSGHWTRVLVGFQAKLGSSKSEIQSFFQQFPQIEVGRFVSNLRRCLLFLNEVEMKSDEIVKIFRYHFSWLGTCRLKQMNTLVSKLNAGKGRLRRVIRQNPEEMKKWTMRSKTQPLRDRVGYMKSKMMRTQFLLEIGYVENSKSMNRALKKFDARGSNLRERYDFMVSLGLNEKDVGEMVRTSPKILSQRTDLLGAKVDYLVNEVGYPMSALVSFPTCLTYTLERMKLRFSMYSWLKDKGKASAELSISTLLVGSENWFARKFVSRHQDGPKHWEDLKRQIQSV